MVRPHVQRGPGEAGVSHRLLVDKGQGTKLLQREGEVTGGEDMVRVHKLGTAMRYLVGHVRLYPRLPTDQT